MPTEDPADEPTDEPAPGRPVAGRPYRTPRYAGFIGTGAVLGVAVAVLLAMGGDGTGTGTSQAGVLGYFAAFGVILGALAGGTVAVVVESVMNRGRRGR